jgi:hypothetical protein
MYLKKIIFSFHEDVYSKQIKNDCLTIKVTNPSKIMKPPFSKFNCCTTTAIAEKHLS